MYLFTVIDQFHEPLSPTYTVINIIILDLCHTGFRNAQHDHCSGYLQLLLVILLLVFIMNW